MAITHIINTQNGTVKVWTIKGDEDAVFHARFPNNRETDAPRHPRTSLQKCASRLLLAEMTGNEPLVEKDKAGRPFLTYSLLSVSISHTDGYAAVMLADGPAAVDVQAISPRILKLRERYLKPEEQLMAPDAEMATLLWAAKETVYKFSATEKHDFRAPISILHISEDTIWASLLKEGVLTRLTLGYRWLSGAALVFIDQADAYEIVT